MTIKERIILELDQTPDFLLEQVFNFLRFLKSSYHFGQGLPVTSATESSAPAAVETSQMIESLSEAERLEKLNQLFGSWADQPDLGEIFETIEENRRAYRGRSIDSLD